MRVDFRVAGGRKRKFTNVERLAIISQCYIEELTQVSRVADTEWEQGTRLTTKHTTSKPIQADIIQDTDDESGTSIHPSKRARPAVAAKPGRQELRRTGKISFQN